jgi:putative transposase
VAPNLDLRTSAARMLTRLFPEETVRKKPRDLGVVRRQGKVDAYAFLMVVTLGLVVRGPTSIAQLGHLFTRVTGVNLARSTFWARLSPEFARQMAWLLDTIMRDSRQVTEPPPGPLACFKDVLAADATVVKVHDDLQHVWKGTRRTSSKAALKVHAWIRALTGELVKCRITREAFGDCKAFGIDAELRGVLMLFDRGYASPSLWRRIH